MVSRFNSRRKQRDLIVALLHAPLASVNYSLVANDFVDAVCGAAFADIKSQVESYGQVDHENFELDPARFKLDLHRLATAISPHVDDPQRQVDEWQNDFAAGGLEELP